MFITTRTLQAFFDNVEQAPAIAYGTIWVDVHQKDRSEFTKDVFFQASVIALDEGGEQTYHILLGIACGMDFLDASNDLQGTAKSKEFVQQVADFAARHGYKVLAGVVGF